MTTFSPPVSGKPMLDRWGNPLNPKVLANLSAPRFQPGTNGYNPGRLSLTERLRHWIAKPLVKPAADAPAIELLIYSTLVGAIAREPGPFAQVWDRIDGKVVETRRNLSEIRFVAVVEGEEAPVYTEAIEGQAVVIQEGESPSEAIVEAKPVVSEGSVVPTDAPQLNSDPVKEQVRDNVPTPPDAPQPIATPVLPASGELIPEGKPPVVTPAKRRHKAKWEFDEYEDYLRDEMGSYDTESEV